MWMFSSSVFSFFFDARFCDVVVDFVLVDVVDQLSSLDVPLPPSMLMSSTWLISVFACQICIFELSVNLEDLVWILPIIPLDVGH